MFTPLFDGKNVSGRWHKVLTQLAKEKHGVRFLWVLEKNVDAIKFYESHGFAANGKKQLEEGTPEYVVMMERKD